MNASYASVILKMCNELAHYHILIPLKLHL